MATVKRERSHSCGACAIQGSFCALPEELRVAFEKLKTSTEYKKGTVLFQEADPVHSVFVVCSGVVKLIMTSQEGKVLLVRLATHGDILGLAEVLTQDARYEYSAVAAEPSALAIIPSAAFKRFVHSYPQASLRLTVALSEQYKAAQRETKLLAFGTTSISRLAHVLLDWSAGREAEFAGGTRIPSHLTQAEIGQAIGSSRETAGRILADLNDRGIVDRTPDEIVIRSREELTRLVKH